MDPNDTARDLWRAGRIEGFDLYFTDYSVLLGDEKGLAGVATSVELFRDARSAQRYMTKQLGEYDSHVGKEVDEIVLRRVRHYDVGDLGDEEAGVELELAQKKDTGRFYVVALRVDRVVATANVFRTDEVSGEDYSRRICSRPSRLDREGRCGQCNEPLVRESDETAVAVPPAPAGIRRRPSESLTSNRLTTRKDSTCAESPSS